MGFHLAVEGFSVHAQNPGSAASIPLMIGEALFNNALFVFGNALLQGHPLMRAMGMVEFLHLKGADKIELPDGQVALQNVLQFTDVARVIVFIEGFQNGARQNGRIIGPGDLA